MWQIIALVGIPLFGVVCLVVGFAAGVMVEAGYKMRHRKEA